MYEPNTKVTYMFTIYGLVLGLFSFLFAILNFFLLFILVIGTSITEVQIPFAIHYRLFVSIIIYILFGHYVIWFVGKIEKFWLVSDKSFMLFIGFCFVLIPIAGIIMMFTVHGLIFSALTFILGLIIILKQKSLNENTTNYLQQ